VVGKTYYFKEREGKRTFGGGLKYTKYNKINSNSENFRRARLLLLGGRPISLVSGLRSKKIN